MKKVFSQENEDLTWPFHLSITQRGQRINRKADHLENYFLVY